MDNISFGIPEGLYHIIRKTDQCIFLPIQKRLYTFDGYYFQLDQGSVIEFAQNEIVSGAKQENVS